MLHTPPWSSKAREGLVRECRRTGVGPKLVLGCHLVRWGGELPEHRPLLSEEWPSIYRAVGRGAERHKSGGDRKERRDDSNTVLHPAGTLQSRLISDVNQKCKD